MPEPQNTQSFWEKTKNLFTSCFGLIGFNRDSDDDAHVPLLPHRATMPNAASTSAPTTRTGRGGAKDSKPMRVVNILAPTLAEMIQAQPVSDALQRNGFQETLLCAGDKNYNEQERQEAGLRKPDVTIINEPDQEPSEPRDRDLYNNVKQVLKKLDSKLVDHTMPAYQIAKDLQKLNPDLVFIRADSKTTLAAAAAASALGIPIAKAEANAWWGMPEMQKDLAITGSDRLANILFPVNRDAASNFPNRLPDSRVKTVGDPMYDWYCNPQRSLPALSSIKRKSLTNLTTEPYDLLTIRNNKDPKLLASILSAFKDAPRRLFLINCPNTINTIDAEDIKLPDTIIPVREPIPITEELALKSGAGAGAGAGRNITDSLATGLRFDFLAKLPSIGLRPNPWGGAQTTENTFEGWNYSFTPEQLKRPEGLEALRKKIQENPNRQLPHNPSRVFGNGDAAKQMVEFLNQEHIRKYINEKGTKHKPLTEVSMDQTPRNSSGKLSRQSSSTSIYTNR